MMGTENAVAEKAISFAIRIVNCCKYLQEEKKEFIMSKQLLRSGTSIGANIHEGIFAQTRADFVTKLSISLKEASETSYWLTILHKTDYLTTEMYDSIKVEIDEIIRILISSLNTTKKNAD